MSTTGAVRVTARELLERASITDVWTALGGGDLRHGRGVAFWRAGDGYNVSVNEAKGTWHETATAQGRHDL